MTSGVQLPHAVRRGGVLSFHVLSHVSHACRSHVLLALFLCFSLSSLFCHFPPFLGSRLIVLAEAVVQPRLGPPAPVQEHDAAVLCWGAAEEGGRIFRTFIFLLNQTLLSLSLSRSRFLPKFTLSLLSPSLLDHLQGVARERLRRCLRR